jgi:hypothetical protein
MSEHKQSLDCRGKLPNGPIRLRVPEADQWSGNKAQLDRTEDFHGLRQKGISKSVWLSLVYAHNPWILPVRHRSLSIGINEIFEPSASLIPIPATWRMEERSQLG